MSFRAEAARGLARVDVRLASMVAAAVALLLSASLFLFFAYATGEALEEHAARFEQAVAEVVSTHPSSSAWQRATLADSLPGVAFRIHGADGAVLAESGRWPDRGRAVEDDPGLWEGLVARGRDHLYVARTLPSGERLEAAQSLRHFSEERAELVNWALVTLGIGLAGTIAVSVFAARRALAPLRAATRAVLDVDPRGLSARIPDRGTGDDVDAHAGALNSVLARLEWAFGRMAAFSSDAAHELRTPVNRILNAADVALLGEKDDDAPVRALVEVRETAESLSSLIDGLLLLARGEEGRLPVRRETVELEGLASSLAEFYRPLFEERGERIELRGEAIHARVDRALIERALANLLENALTHTPPGSIVRVQVGRHGEGATILVEDSGAGIPEAEIEHVFERFVQLDPARSRRGAGIGLPIARMIARLHGGDLRVAKSDLGGAAFTLYLGAASTFTALPPEVR